LTEILTRRFGHQLPKSMVEAICDGSWPKGRISGERFADAPFLKLKGIDLELESCIDRIRLDNSPIATLASLVSLFGIDAGIFNLDNDAKPAHDRAIYKVLYGSQYGTVPDLPYLDTANAICIGGGASYGDDTWVLLDLRANSSDPRVICNEWVWEHGETGARVLLDFRWLQIARSLSDFLAMARE